MSKKIVIIVWKESQFQNSWVGKYIWNYIPYLKENFNVEIFYQPEKHWMVSWFYWRIFTLPKIIKKEYKDYIKVFYDENFLISVRPKYAKSTIVIVHHYPFKTKVTNLKEHIIRWLSFITFNTILRKIHHIVVVSNKTKETLKEIWIKEKYITVIPNSVDISYYKVLNEEEKNKKRENISKKYKVPMDKKWLLYVWSNESRKNLLTLFKVLSKLSDDYILVRVWKDWGTEELEKMNKIINENNLKNRYYHLQDLSEEDLISLYQVSDVYLMPSLYEWFGRPIIEAQACWCPVISTKCWALEEVCWEWALLLNDPMDENEYIENINKILEIKGDLTEKWKLNAEKYSNEKNVNMFISIVNWL